MPLLLLVTKLSDKYCNDLYDFLTKQRFRGTVNFVLGRIVHFFLSLESNASRKRISSIQLSFKVNSKSKREFDVKINGESFNNQSKLNNQHEDSVANKKKQEISRTPYN